MIREIEHSVQARTNPIFLTGKTAACLMADAGIPDADSIVSRLGLQSGDFGMSDPILCRPACAPHDVQVPGK